MHFLARLVGIGLVAGAAVAAVKILERIAERNDMLDDVVYTVQAGTLEPDIDTDVPVEPDEPVVVHPAPDDTAPNINPVDAPPVVPVTDPTKIADPADFQDWDELGCRG